MKQETLEDIERSSSMDPLDTLKKAIVTYDNELAISSATKAIEQGKDPLKIMDAMTIAIRLVGDAFGRDELWLPQLVGASEAMLRATPLVEEEIKKTGAEREVLGRIVIGTVFGDIHTIGKTMVATLLTAEGFEVHDIGINVKAEEFIEAVKKYNANILAMSALMTTTAPEQMKVIETAKKAGLRDKMKVMVGGGAINEEFADSIGADGYEPTAPRAVKLARTFVGK